MVEKKTVKKTTNVKKPVASKAQPKTEKFCLMKNMTFWRVLSGVLLIAFVIALVFALTGSNSADKENAVEFSDEVIELMIGESLTSANVSMSSGLFILTYNISGQDINVYVSEDAKLLFTQAITEDQVEQAKAQMNEPPQAEEPEVYEIETEGQPSIGSQDAPITIVEFSDYGCPFCSAVEGTANVDYMLSQDPTWKPFWPSIQEYIDNGTVRFVYREYPVESLHPNAPKASEGAKCAEEQELFWEYKEVMYSNQEALNAGNTDTIKELASEIDGLDTAVFDECLDSGKYTVEVESDIAYVEENLGQIGTPTFFINGKKISGAQSFSVFEAEIASILAE